MLQRFLSVRKTHDTEDKENAPLLPISNSPSPGGNNNNTSTSPSKLNPPTLSIPAPPRKKLLTTTTITTPSPTDEELVPITVDNRMPTTFYIPRKYLTNALHKTRKVSSSQQHKRHYSAADASSLKEYYLPKLQAHHIYDFTVWVKTGSVLQYHHGGAQSRVEADVARLIEAVAVGVYLECRGFVEQAMREMREVAALLDRPDDFVSVVMAATSAKNERGGWESFHPVVRLWIAVVAAKTKESRAMPLGRDGSAMFWEAYDEYCLTNKCLYPADTDGFWS